MREFIITLFIILVVIIILAVIFIKLYESYINKKTIEKFLSENDFKDLGNFKCYVNKNFLSPSNYNYAFDSLRLIEIDKGYLMCPTNNYFFNITRQLKPFVLSNKSVRYKNIDVNQIEAIRNLDNSTYITFKAKYNTIINLQIYDAEGILIKLI